MADMRDWVGHIPEIQQRRKRGRSGSPGRIVGGAEVPNYAREMRVCIDDWVRRLHDLVWHVVVVARLVLCRGSERREYKRRLRFRRQLATCPKARTDRVQHRPHSPNSTCFLFHRRRPYPSYSSGDERIQYSEPKQPF